MFENIDEPDPKEIKIWLLEIKFSTDEASRALGISKRQFLRFLSGETKAKKFHALAMQMIWLFEENKKDNLKKNFKSKNKRIIKIPIR